MIETPEIVTNAPQAYAAIALVVPSSEIREHIASGCAELTQVLRAQGIEPTGPWFTHHHRRPADTFNFEICFPVPTAVVPEGRVRMGFWEPARVARTVYRGSYAELAHAWGELYGWLQAEGLTGREEFWEVYLVNPNTEPNPELWRTQLNWPLS